MRSGRRVAAAPPLDAVREHARDQLASLPAALKRLGPFSDAVKIGASFREFANDLDRVESAGGPGK
jgi:nicotinate phosphoribosyltransferase